MGVCRLWEGSSSDSKGERERKKAQRAFRLGMRITGKRGGEVQEGKQRVKSGSPCTACGSKTRSSFLHLQVERRSIRVTTPSWYSLSDPRFCPSRPHPVVIVFVFAFVWSEIVPKRTMEIASRGKGHFTNYTEGCCIWRYTLFTSLALVLRYSEVGRSNAKLLLLRYAIFHLF